MKTYLWTNSFITPFPQDFLANKNKKFIVVEQCKATYKQALVGDVIMHASFIQRDHYMDYACCFINEEPNRDTAKYEVLSFQPSFKVWFTDLAGNNVNDDINNFALRLLLIY